MYYNQELMPNYESRMIYMFNVKRIDVFDTHVSYITDRITECIEGRDLNEVSGRISEDLGIEICDKSSAESIANQITSSDKFAPILTTLRLKREDLFLNISNSFLDRGDFSEESNKVMFEEIDYKKGYEDSLREKELDELNFDILLECLSNLIDN